MAIALTHNDRILLADLEAEDIPEAQRVFDESPHFHRLLHGRVADPDMATRCFHHTPPTPRHGLRVWKHFIGIFPPQSDDVIGLIDIFVGFPRYDVATIATFVLRESFQRRGFGAAALDALIAWLRRRHPALLRLDITITDDNIPATRFLLSHGFERTDLWDRIDVGEQTKRVITLRHPMKG